MSADIHRATEQAAADRYLDCTGVKCPLPIVKVSKAIKEMPAGQTLSVEATDPAFKSDLEAWVRTMGHELLSFSEGPVQQALIRKSSLTGPTR